MKWDLRSKAGLRLNKGGHEGGTEKGRRGAGAGAVQLTVRGCVMDVFGEQRKGK